MAGYAGVVVLGGGVHSKYVGFAPQHVQLSEVSDRMVQAVVLLRKYPRFFLIYTNQEAASKRTAAPDTSAPSQAERFFTEMGGSA